MNKLEIELKKNILENHIEAKIILKGVINAVTTPDLEEVLDKLYDENIIFWLMDLSDVSYISSYGIGLLLSSLGKLRHNDGNIQLYRLSKTVRDMLHLSGLSKVFDVLDKNNKNGKENNFF